MLEYDFVFTNTHLAYKNVYLNVYFESLHYEDLLVEKKYTNSSRVCVCLILICIIWHLFNSTA